MIIRIKRKTFSSQAPQRKGGFMDLFKKASYQPGGVFYVNKRPVPLPLDKTEGQKRKEEMSSRIKKMNSRIKEANREQEVGPDLTTDHLKEMWDVWKFQGAKPGDKGYYLDKDYRKERFSVKAGKDKVYLYLNVDPEEEKTALEDLEDSDTSYGGVFEGYKTSRIGKTLVIETPNNEHRLFENPIFTVGYESLFKPDRPVGPYVNILTK